MEISYELPPLDKGPDKRKGGSKPIMTVLCSCGRKYYVAYKPEIGFGVSDMSHCPGCGR